MVCDMHKDVHVLFRYQLASGRLTQDQANFLVNKLANLMHDFGVAKLFLTVTSTVAHIAAFTHDHQPMMPEHQPALANALQRLTVPYNLTGLQLELDKPYRGSPMHAELQTALDLVFNSIQSDFTKHPVPLNGQIDPQVMKIIQEALAYAEAEGGQDGRTALMREIQRYCERCDEDSAVDTMLRFLNSFDGASDEPCHELAETLRATLRKARVSPSDEGANG